MDGTDATAWSRIDDFDGAAALIDAVLDLDSDDEYTRSELSEVADVDYKTLYLEGTVQAVVELGLLERAGSDPEQTFRPATDRSVFDAARAFANVAGVEAAGAESADTEAADAGSADAEESEQISST